MSITAAHCAKTLIIASTHGSPALRQCTKLLLPGMIECLAKIAATEPSETYDMQIQIAGEIFKAFSTLFTSTADEHSKFQVNSAQSSLLMIARIAVTWRVAARYDADAGPDTDSSVCVAHTSYRAGAAVGSVLSIGVQGSHGQVAGRYEGDIGDFCQTGFGRVQVEHCRITQTTDITTVILAIPIRRVHTSL